MKHQAAARVFEKSHTRSEIANFFLSPSQHPEMVLNVLIEDRRRAQERRRLARAFSPRAARSSWRLPLRTGVMLCVVMFLSCAVAPNHSYKGIAVPVPSLETAFGNPGQDVVPVQAAMMDMWNAARAMVSGSPLPRELAESFAGRLMRGDWSGIALIGGEGEVKALARGETYARVSEWITRYHGVEEENNFLRQAMEKLRMTQDSKKVYLEINLTDNRLYVKMGPNTLYDFPVVTGKGYTSRESGRSRVFATPRGILSVKKKEVDPIWMPPAWNWTEKGLEVPAVRYAVRGHLGKYRLNLGDGYGIHGTSNGHIRPGKYSHGCIRMNAKDLETVFKITDVGTEVYVY
jgi:hypothetical protein